jgi:hypothetical protein
MVSRRELLSGGVLSLAGAGGAARRDEVPQDIDLRPALSATSGGVAGVREQLERDTAGLAISRDFISQIRKVQKQHYRTHGRFPIWIDIGIDVFESVYDWHIRNLQVPTVARDAAGRITVSFFFSTLTCRPDFEPNYISAPYDEK